MEYIAETDILLNRDGTVYHLNIHPKHLSDKIIIVGEPSNVFQISQHFDSITYEMNKGEFITHIGQHKGNVITVISTGMGTDNTETLVTELDILANVDLTTRKIRKKKRKLEIIRLGTTSAIQEDIAIGSFFISEYALGLDNVLGFYNLDQDEFSLNLSEKLKHVCNLDFTPYVVSASDSLLKKFKNTFQTGNTVTCPGFYAPQGRSIRLPLKYPTLIENLTYFHHDNIWFTNMDMETSTLYGLCGLLGHNVISINVVTANQIKNKYSKDPNKIFEVLIKKVLGNF